MQTTAVPWDHRWKAVSMEGYDVVRNKIIDYGNREYTTILAAFMVRDTKIAECVTWLSGHWPSLHPFNSEHTNHSVEMQADIIEIVMAALRGHDLFCEVLTPLYERISQFRYPRLQVFQYLCNVAQCVQYLDASLLTGWLKFRQARVPKLEPLQRSPFQQLWMEPRTRAYCLAFMAASQ